MGPVAWPMHSKAPEPRGSKSNALPDLAPLTAPASLEQLLVLVVADGLGRGFGSASAVMEAQLSEAIKEGRAKRAMLE